MSYSLTFNRYSMLCIQNSFNVDIRLIIRRKSGFRRPSREAVKCVKRSGNSEFPPRPPKP
jgi:hypothetical protein